MITGFHYYDDFGCDYVIFRRELPQGLHSARLFPPPPGTKRFERNVEQSQIGNGRISLQVSGKVQNYGQAIAMAHLQNGLRGKLSRLDVALAIC